MLRRSFLGFGLAVLSAPVVFAAPLTYAPDSFDSAIASGKPVLVHVHADWCPTCRAQAPILDKITADAAYKDLVFMRANFDTDLDFRKKYHVGQQSTILLFKGGKEIARSIGVTNEDGLKLVVKQAL